MMKQGPYAELAKRQELAKDLTAIRGIQIPGDGIARRPTIEIELLAEPERLTQFLEVFDGVLSNAKDASPKLS